MIMLPDPAPGFDDPLELLRTCHERILQQCATLTKIADHLATRDPTEEVRAAAVLVHRYFSTAGQLHHEDEEQDLFPLLRADPALADLIAQLQKDHVHMGSLWRELEPRLLALETIDNVHTFHRQVAAFNACYAQHIARENQELLPRASELLPTAVLAVLGARMAARRRVNF